MTAPVKANLVAGVKDCWETRRPGDFTYTGRQGLDGIFGMVFVCPCGCGDTGGLDFGNNPDRDHPRWTWDGNRETPTLTPSINKVVGCGWHGWLRNGEFVSV